MPVPCLRISISISFQDTLQINGQAYITNCYIEGDVDFMWGKGPCFFENCEAKSLRSNAYYTQIRNPATNHGYVYKNCTFNGAAGVTGNFLSRIAPVQFPASEVVLINCTLTDAVSPVAWRLDQATEAPDVHFWESNSHAPDGQPVDMSKRLPIAKQLKQPEDKQIDRKLQRREMGPGGPVVAGSATLTLQARGSRLPFLRFQGAHAASVGHPLSGCFNSK